MMLKQEDSLKDYLTNLKQVTSIADVKTAFDSLSVEQIISTARSCGRVHAGHLFLPEQYLEVTVHNLKDQLETRGWVSI